MFENGIFVPYLDKSGRWNLGLGSSSGYVSYFDELTTTDLTTNFSWDVTKAYIPTTGTGAKVSSKDATTGIVTEAFKNELNKLLVVDPSGNVGVETKNKIKLDKLLEGAGKVIGLASNIWDLIDPTRIAQRSAGPIQNNNTGEVGTDNGGGIIPVNQNTNKAGGGSAGGGSGGGSGGSGGGSGYGNGFNFTQFVTDNIYLVAVIVGILIFAFLPNGEKMKGEKSTNSSSNSTLIYVAIGVVLVLIIPKLTAKTV